ncbi:helix-turn-helix domain-containing protein [Clostridioides difficile]|nr:XRE family transcriptional regulator [Clostridioides difficile]EKG0757104.1 helix-turn-helix domain-containing protein [Clostridioides difficile]EKG0783387.1 helix-turn-helix domain-containing protein [Clostridioides difficile]EKS6760184.1 helix-turn-helix domain-containing protein [Clostridioides difficile]MBH7872537.1 helix-turn-helix domain-containing protein [Clostridioides difficile]
MKNTGHIIKILRIEKKLTQDELAKNLNSSFNLKLNKGMISKWESNKAEPRFEYIKYISKYFDVSIDYLLGMTEYRNMYDNFDKKYDSKKLSLEVKEIEKNGEKIKEKNKVLENKLLSSFNALNDIGQNEAIKRVDELTQIGKYVNKNHIDTIAAHNEHLHEEGEIEKIYQDLDDMDNW